MGEEEAARIADKGEDTTVGGTTSHCHASQPAERPTIVAAQEGRDPATAVLEVARLQAAATAGSWGGTAAGFARAAPGWCERREGLAICRPSHVCYASNIGGAASWAHWLLPDPSSTTSS